MVSTFAGLIPPAVVTAVVTFVVAAAVFAVWVANRKRIAAETLGRAEEQALRIVKDAERDAETKKKEALLEAKEKAHDLLIDAERRAHQQRQQAAALEQTLGRRETALGDRQTSTERLEKELTARERALNEREKSTAAASARYEQLSQPSSASSSAWRA